MDEEKFNYVEGVVDYLAPYEWNAGHAAYRMIRGFEVLCSMPGRVGPKTYGSTWPTMLTEFSDLAEESAWKRRLREAFDGESERWSAEEIALADEALSWPLRYLADRPMQADAIQIWAYSKASGRSLARLLRSRADKAATAARQVEAHENARRRELRAHVARTVVAWANDRIAERPERRVDLIANARIKMERACRGYMPVVVRPSQAVRDRILSRKSLDRYLSNGLDLLARRLSAAGVPVR